MDSHWHLEILRLRVKRWGFLMPMGLLMEIHSQMVKRSRWG